VEQKPGKEITWAVGNVDFLVEQAHWNNMAWAILTE
jgi:hypothetical protein